MTVKIVPEIFADVIVNTNEPNPASPDRPTNLKWHGILIKMPERIYFTQKALEKLPDHRLTIPICGFFLAEYRPEIEPAPMTIIAVNMDSGEKFTGAVRETDPSLLEDPDEGVSPPSPADLAGTSTGGFFNHDLCTFVDIPMGSGRYEVTVTFAGYESNPAPIRFVEEQ